MAIGIKVNKINSESEPLVSKFFGDPVIPNDWVEKWSDDVIFFCQIKLSDIADLDTDNNLPHSGYLYVFLDVESYPYTPMVYYYDGEPDTIIDDFNENEPKFGALTQGYEMTFSLVDDNAEGMKLFGVPADWNYEEPSKKLFLQFDPLEGSTGFLDSIDGFMYLFFGDNVKDLDEVSLHIEQS